MFTRPLFIGACSPRDLCKARALGSRFSLRVSGPRGSSGFCVARVGLIHGRCRARGPRAMESMVEENGSAVDPLAQGSQSGETAPTIVTSVQSLDRNHQQQTQQTHQLVASTSIVQLTLPSSAATQVYRTTSCVSMHFLSISNLFSFVYRDPVQFAIISRRCKPKHALPATRS